MDVISMLATSALAAGGSYAAIVHQGGTLRFPIYKDRDAWWNDWRLLVAGLGLIGLLVADPKGGWRYLWGILGTASLASYATTELVRMQTVRRLGSWDASQGGAAGQGALPMGAQAQIPSAVPPVQGQTVTEGDIAALWNA